MLHELSHSVRGISHGCRSVLRFHLHLHIHLMYINFFCKVERSEAACSVTSSTSPHAPPAPFQHRVRLRQHARRKAMSAGRGREEERRAHSSHINICYVGHNRAEHASCWLHAILSSNGENKLLRWATKHPPFMICSRRGVWVSGSDSVHVSFYLVVFPLCRCGARTRSKYLCTGLNCKSLAE